MTEAERDAALQELVALRAALLAEQQRIARTIHELLNVLAVIKGEVDLAADRGRALIEDFYQRWPEVKDIK